MNPKVWKGTGMRKKNAVRNSGSPFFLPLTSLLSEFSSPSLKNDLLLSTVHTVSTDGCAIANEFIDFRITYFKREFLAFSGFYVEASGHPHPMNT